MRFPALGVLVGIFPVTMVLLITPSVGQNPFAPPVAERTWAEDDGNWEFLVNPSLGRMNSRFRAPLSIVRVVGPEAQAALEIGPHQDLDTDNPIAVISGTGIKERIPRACAACD